MQLVAASHRRNIVHFHFLFEEKMLIVHLNGDNHIQNSISDRISCDILPQMKILNTVIP